MLFAKISLPKRAPPLFLVRMRETVADAVCSTASRHGHSSHYSQVDARRAIIDTRADNGWYLAATAQA